MYSSRRSALEAICNLTTVSGRVDYTTKPFTDVYGEHVFNERVQRERLPKSVFKALQKTIRAGEELEWSRDGSGRWQSREVPGPEFELKADLVLLALGFLRVEHGSLVKDFNLATDARGNITVDANLMTSTSGVFAGGDAVLGASLVVRAIALGRRAAESIHRYLS